jgi:hypothetical protein
VPFNCIEAAGERNRSFINRSAPPDSFEKTLVGSLKPRQDVVQFLQPLGNMFLLKDEQRRK